MNRITKNNPHKNPLRKKRLLKSKGFTLIELMIGITVSLLVMAGVTNVFVATVVSSAKTLKASKLNQELSAIMSILVSDVRRSGYWNNTLGTGLGNTTPYRVSVAAGSFPSNPLDINTIDTDGDGIDECILYSYDNKKDGVNVISGGTNYPENDERYGFQRIVTGGVGNVLMRTASTENTAYITNCTDDGNNAWTVVSDINVINITALTFTRTGSRCLNTTTGTSWNTTCALTGVTPTAGDVLVETRQVVITLNGQLVSDSAVTKKITESIKIRNNLIIDIT